MAQKEISKSVMYRLSRYLMYLKAMPEDSPANISATMLANALNMGEVQVRKDLALVSDGGRPKVGYNRKALIDDIDRQDFAIRNLYLTGPTNIICQGKITDETLSL